MPGEGARVSGSGSAAEVRFANSLPFFARGDGKEGRKGVGRGRKKGVVGGEGWKRGSPSLYCTVVQEEEEEARDGSKASPHFHSAAAAAFVQKKGVDGDVASVVAVAAAVAAAFIWPRGMDGGGRVGRGMEQRRWK